MGKRFMRAVGGLAALGVALAGQALAQNKAEKRNMELVGYNDLQGRTAYQPVIHKQGNRWIAYVGHIPGEPGLAEAGGGQMVRVSDGNELPKGDKSKVYLLRTFGNAAHEIWDVTDPAKPGLLTTIIKGLKGTHKNWWECDSGIAYLVSGIEGWRVRRMTQVYDLSDPAKPVFIRNFGLPGQQPGGAGPPPTGLHGAISLGPNGNRVYFGYGTGAGG